MLSDSSWRKMTAEIFLLSTFAFRATVRLSRPYQSIKFQGNVAFRSIGDMPNLIYRPWRQCTASFLRKRMQKLEVGKSDRHRAGESLSPASTLKDLRKTS